MNHLAEETDKTSIYRKIRNLNIEEILNILEKEIEKHLSVLLPPRTDYNITISLTKGRDRADFAVDIAVRGSTMYSRELDKAVLEAINYSKKRFIELLDEKAHS